MLFIFESGFSPKTSLAPDHRGWKNFTMRQGWGDFRNGEVRFYDTIAYSHMSSHLPTKKAHLPGLH